MSLRDVVSGLNASIWQQVALVLFVIAFVAIVVNAWLRPRAEVDQQARLPLEDDEQAGQATQDRNGSGDKP